MTEIRTKDKLFLAAVIPVAIIGAYCFCWRAEAVRRIARLESMDANLVEVEDFPMEKAKAERAMKNANEELAAEKAAPIPETKVVGNAKAGEAERELAMLNLFREAGLTVIRSGAEEKGGSRDERAQSVLRATGVCPKPLRRVYDLVGPYPAVVRALEAMSERKSAAIPESVTMRSAADDRWTISIWL